MKPGLERRMKKLEQELVRQGYRKNPIKLVLCTEDDEPLGVEISPNLFEVPDENDSPDVSDSIL